MREDPNKRRSAYALRGACAGCNAPDRRHDGALDDASAVPRSPSQHISSQHTLSQRIPSQATPSQLAPSKAMPSQVMPSQVMPSQAPMESWLKDARAAMAARNDSSGAVPCSFRAQKLYKLQAPAIRQCLTINIRRNSDRLGIKGLFRDKRASACNIGASVSGGGGVDEQILSPGTARPCASHDPHLPPVAPDGSGFSAENGSTKKVSAENASAENGFSGTKDASGDRVPGTFKDVPIYQLRSRDPEHGQETGPADIPVLKLWTCAIIGLAMVAAMLSMTGTVGNRTSPAEITTHFEKRLALLKREHRQLDAEITGLARYDSDGVKTHDVTSFDTISYDTTSDNRTSYGAPADSAPSQNSELAYRMVASTSYWPPDRSVTRMRAARGFGDQAASYSSFDPVQFGPVQIETARIRNDERRCLAEAMYYEAAFEPDLGQFAVADVVLNRVKSPLYPDSICAVVYEGAQRETGCQFSFTCDGALDRPRSQSLFAAMERRAGAILAGMHMPVSRNATHYHAAYVSPYWAASLEPTLQIGAHKFYKVRARPSPIRSAALSE